MKIHEYLKQYIRLAIVISNVLNLIAVKMSINISEETYLIIRSYPLDYRHSFLYTKILHVISNHYKNYNRNIIKN